MTNIPQIVASRLGLPLKGVEAVIGLLDEGATVPFISRYRKERTGSLDEVAVRSVESTLAKVREHEKRKEFVLQAIEAAGALTPELRRKIEETDDAVALEDLYAPYKPKRRTRAAIAREKGLEPLAKKIMSGHVPANASDEDIEGASDIIAEWVSETPRVRNIVRRAFSRSASIESSVVKGKEAELAASPFADMASFSRAVGRCQSHQVLALHRAERLGLVKLRFTFEQEDRVVESVENAFVPERATGESREIIARSVGDAYKRLLRPSIENETLAAMKEEADKVAIAIFADNLRQLLMAAPLRGKSVLAIDPGYRTGCKVVALDAQGNLIDETVIYPTEPRRDWDGATRALTSLIRKHHLEVVALGNGTASRETERFLLDRGIVTRTNLYVVSEDGASVYSASDIARSEFPDKDVTVRGAVSIGRRLIDPLAELVKIDPKSIGVGQYQHEVDQSALKDALDFTVLSCVNNVGVDVNTASATLLSYISGIGPALASNIVAYREANGPFADRKSLRKVPRLGDKAFEQCAGFMRVPGSRNPLDNTGIHPESYGLVEDMAKSLGARVADLPANATLLDSVDVHRLAREGLGGFQTLTDIVAELRKPGRDPRTDDGDAAFVPEVDSFESLAPGMVIPGKVTNITAFGAFVDLGIKENGLVHISQISERRVNAVSDVLKLGQKVTVKILDIDSDRRRISLTMKGI